LTICDDPGQGPGHSDRNRQWLESGQIHAI